MPTQELKPLKKIRRSQSKYPWDEIRMSYIEGLDVGTPGSPSVYYPTPRQVAEHYSAPVEQVRNRASRERWEDHRAAFQNRVVVERQRERAKDLAGKAIQWDEEIYADAELGRSLVARRMSDMLVAADAGGKISGYELEKLANALSKFQDIGRKALGIEEGQAAPTQNVEINQINISEELARTDDQRIAGLISVLARGNTSLDGADALRELVGGVTFDPDADEEPPVEGEIVEDTPEMAQIEARMEQME